MVLSLFAAPLLAIAVTVFVCSFIYYAFLIPPSNFPKDIPTVPFYFTLLPMLKDADQEALYRRYLEAPLQQYGAVKIFFASRWNILVQRPDYLAEIFKYEDVYAKSGNQRKIPYSVLGGYTGDNIISAHGENWRLYKSIMQPGLQRDPELEPVLRNVQILIRLILEQQGSSKDGTVLLSQLLQRYTLANLSECMLGTESEALQRHDAPLHNLQHAVKRETVRPLFLNFPFLDLLPLRSRRNARQLVSDFTDLLCSTVVENHQHHHDSSSKQRLGCSLVAARESGLLTETQFRHNIAIIFLAGHENPQLLLTSLIFLLGEHQDVQERLRQEILSQGTAQIDYPALQNLPYLTSVIYEALRMFPPISQLISRKTTEPVLLGGKIPIPPDTYVGYNAYATGHDPEAWGDRADYFQPERWGSTIDKINAQYRRVNSRASFIAFHGGRRACLGQKFAMFEARVTIAELVRNLKWTIDPTWPRQMTPAGPLAPKMLRAKFEELVQRPDGEKDPSRL